MKKVLTDKHKYMAYILNQDPDLNYTQKEIGEFMHASQATVSNAIAYVKNQRLLMDLSKQLDEARETLRQNGIPAPAPALCFDKLKKKSGK